MSEILVVILDIALLVVAASGAFLVATMEPKIEKGWWLMVFGLFILALGHVTETLFSEVFKMSFLVNEIQHRLWILAGFIIIVSGISFICRSRMAEKTDEGAKEKSAKENKISSGKAELSSAGKAELSSVGRQFAKFANFFSNFTF